jgi:WD40 repeat protein
VQKGPFAIGSQVSVNELDESLNPNGKVYNVQTSDDLGNFAVASNIGTHLVEMVGDGFYMDDLTGQLAASRIQLRAIADLSLNTTPTINILTSLQGQRLRKLISQGIAYAAADTQSRNEVLTTFGIDPAKINSLTTLYSMRINGSTDADSVLLAVSAILSKMATNAAVTNSTTQPAELSNYISTIAAQIALNGAITNPAIITAWKLAASQLDLVAVRSNLESYYLNRGITLVAPKFEEWVDKDGSGILPRRLVPVSGVTFTDSPAANPGQLITSNIITIAGLGAGIGAPVTVSAGATILKNNVAVSGTFSSVVDGDTLAFGIPALDYGLTENVTITVGTSSTTWRVETRPPAPFSVFTVSGIGQVTVSWSQVISATSYNIYWGTTAGVTTASTKIAGVTSPYVQTGLTAGSTYFYRVSAMNAAGETLSNETFSFLYTGGNPGGTFTATGSMATARNYNTATLLPNGKVLIAGGYNLTVALATAEIHDPVTGVFTATGSMTTARYQPTATLLPNGKVLIAGGLDPTGNTTLASAELYDPATGIFTATGSMTTARYLYTATLLPNGKVLITGGFNLTATLASAELYDPATGIFTATGTMTSVRNLHAATLLGNGKVLVLGGAGQGTSKGFFASAEIYDPATGIFTATGSMTTPRYSRYFPATLLPNGKVLVAGGISYDATGSTILASAELYDPATGVFTATGSMTTPRDGNTVTLLPNGKVLVAGGSDVANNIFASAELYDPATGIFTATGSMTTARDQPTATLLPNGKVLIAGGWSGAIIASAELFQ